MNDLDFTSLASHFPYEELVPEVLREPTGVNLLNGTTSHLGLVYRAVLGWRPLRLDLHLPADATGPVPVIVYIHGGSFVGGVPEMGPWTDLPLRGFAVAAVTYRLAAEATFPQPVDDINAAVGWLREHCDRWGLDPTRIALWSSSAGGFIAGTAALSSTTDAQSSCRAVICHYPLVDPRTLVEDALPGGEDSAAKLSAILRRFLPGDAPQTTLTDLVESADDIPPFFIAHGTSDRRVGPCQSRRLHEALISRGADSRLRMAEHADHGSSYFYSTAAIDEVVEFLREVWD